MATPFKFHLPAECRSFTLFPRLPIEVRHKIWEAYLSDPGINFVKLQICDRGWRSQRVPLRSISLGTVTARSQEPVDDDSGSGLDAVDLMVIQKDFNPRPFIHAKLAAQNPHWRGDASRYEVLYRQLAVLSMTCVESANLVKNLVSRPGVLRMENGNILTLDNSPDLVFLDYLPNNVYQFNFTLDIRLFCPGLDLVRRVAVRFSHTWKSERDTHCHSCTIPNHHAGTRTYPIHLYQFLARCLPNLEEFYFVDYFVVPRDKQQGRNLVNLASNGNGLRPLQVFRAKDRWFCEIMDGEASASKWKVEPEVFNIRDWLRDRFVRYAKASHTSRHKAPERVYFGVLACDWNVGRPVTRRGPSTTPFGHLRAKPTSSKPTPGEIASGKTKLYVGHRPTRCEPSVTQNQTPMFSIDLNMPPLNSSESRNKPLKLASKQTGENSETGKPSLDGSVFQFGAGRGNAFNFTFKQTYGSLARWAGL
ncbi:RNAse P Rpr2/Rpp21/SNM1 subunit [Hirsutella rhossiliensis]|uniref:RNAse P Rpr2/Rpp21/SNM1 subunit domain-containing protein n=1 Tax=Hirsutella rhossiliensis TaxID=111463 RepID=A0A9P8N3X8_9HYPO|nr:RNAse P Rpr2/Rpp21/SNM1 subunit domain-containing protein [Hirsutella rhossiliensis]KAH0966369.1 RNAse P Rpr2/Rpp21/SNM1 subunit domain-containing protein [Hirsutella rhossiliensis]